MKTLPRFVAAPYQNIKQQSPGFPSLKVPDYGDITNSRKLFIAPYEDCEKGPDIKAVCIIGKDEPCSGCRTCLRFWY